MTTPAVKTPTRMTPRQWAEAEALWEAGEVTLDDLATRFDKDRSAFVRYFKKHGIVKGSRAAARKEEVKEAVAAAGIDEATVLANRIRETKEDHYKMSSALAKLVWAEVLTAKKDEKPFSAIKDNLKALDNAMNVLMKARMERFAILGLDKDDYVDEDGLPELVISELTAAQIEELRNRDEEGLEAGTAVIPETLQEEIEDEDEEDGIVEEGDD
ncbi:TPA: hypothetical protein NWA32_004177 [Escherichia coli]|nr:hypothetical protein [Escherichia coli]